MFGDVVQSESAKTQVVGHVGGSFKPFHAGHYALVEQAYKDGCTEIRLYVSPKDRGRITGAKTRRIFQEILEPSFPSIVKVHYSEQSPVKDILVNLKFGDSDQSTFHFVYTDEKDAPRFHQDQVAKFAPSLVSKSRVVAKVLNRQTTEHGISGTKMREFLDANDKDSFLSCLPGFLTFEQKNQIWNIVYSP